MSRDETLSIADPQVTQVYCGNDASRRRRYDFLLVVDDSPSIAKFQPNLAEKLANFIHILESPDVDLDSRIGVTTTSVPGPGCESTGPALRFDSCLERVEDFVVENAPRP